MTGIAARLALGLLLCSILSFCGVGHTAAGEVTYIYDPLGRLVGVVDGATNEVGIFRYDGVGNLLAIERRSAALVSIIEFTPSSGPVGTGVTIYGTGFSSTPTVTFSGTTAAVSSATPTQIVTTVPAGAATGPITVTAPGGSATTSMPFSVGSETPTITALAPTVGTPGTAVTITGTNFEPTTTGNRVAFNEDVALAAVGSATTTSIATSVPSKVGSGRIAVATPSGRAVSSGDFFVPPSPHIATNVETTGRMAVGGDSFTAGITAANRIALVVFDAAAGQQASLGVTTTVPAGYIAVYLPEGTALAPPTVVSTTAGAGFDLGPFPRSGTYTVLIDPYLSYTGNTTLTLSEELTGTVTVDGAALPLTLRSGQNGRITFSGTAGQRVSLAMTAVTITQSAVSIYKPDGGLLTGPVTILGGFGGGTIDTELLPTTGSYTIVIDPVGGYSGNMTLTLSTEITGALALDGDATTVNISRPGQRARLSFTGTSGQRVSLAATGVTIGSACCSVVISIIQPDGTTLVSGSYGTVGGTLDFPPFPTTGTYEVLVDPNGALTGSATLLLSSEITGSIVVDGASVPLMISRVGQNARLTFVGASGQHLKVTVGGVTMVQVYISVLKPDGTNLLAPQLTFNGTTTYDLGTLPAGGTYAIFINPYQLRTGNATFTLWSVVP